MKYKLSELKIGELATIIELTQNQDNNYEESISLRLMEMGVVAGAHIKILHEAPFGRDPIAIEVRGVLIGIRRKEADSIIVEKNTEDLK